MYIDLNLTMCFHFIAKQIFSREMLLTVEMLLQTLDNKILLSCTRLFLNLLKLYTYQIKKNIFILPSSKIKKRK